jgi:hypothetical protein
VHEQWLIRTLVSITAWWLYMPVAGADPIHAITQGAFQHHDSGWIFPQQVAGFKRVGAPQDVDGSRDAVAYYARAEKRGRSTAVIDIYPKDSAVGAVTVAQAQTALEREAGLAAAKRVHTRLEVSKPALAIAKVSYRAGTVTTCLYFTERGEWIVKIRLSSATLAPRAMDDFVRNQRWESLAGD